MVRTINVKADIPANRELDLHITLPADVPQGPADIVLVVASTAGSEFLKAGDLLDSDLFGMWRDRSDILDSIDFARTLRIEGWKRSAS
jgi:hypothetical protein